ncbi:hypothetical protein ACFVZ8_32245 [Streptomyces sp. NPDC059558]|uniref:hypothetical protein n=1 Tax=Streptomyces sp. NPDC059558 TaxID=3346864 RepID=UPI0036994545
MRELRVRMCGQQPQQGRVRARLADEEVFAGRADDRDVAPEQRGLGGFRVGRQLGDGLGRRAGEERRRGSLGPGDSGQRGGLDAPSGADSGRGAGGGAGYEWGCGRGGGGVRAAAAGSVV